YFADDLKIFRSISSHEDNLSLNLSLSYLAEWCSLWKLNLNLSKCFFMSISNNKSNKLPFNYSINQYILTEVSTFKDLGVLYTNNLKFKTHISSIINKSFRMLGFIKRNTNHFTNYHTIIT